MSPNKTIYVLSEDLDQSGILTDQNHRVLLSPGILHKNSEDTGQTVCIL